MQGCGEGRTRVGLWKSSEKQAELRGGTVCREGGYDSRTGGIRRGDLDWPKFCLRLHLYTGPRVCWGAQPLPQNCAA